MIDTHLHILPGIDDGPETIEEALLLAKALVQEGVHTAIATPHYNDLYPQRSALEVRERVNELQRVIDQHTIPLRLFSGHEALIKPGLSEDIQTGRLATLNGSRYLLLELWNQSWLPWTDQVIFELRAIGVTPILAHPERYRFFQKEPQRLEALLQKGVLLQITASSLVGKQGRTAQRTAEALLKRGLVHCIASDAHSLRMRSPHVLEGLHYAQQLLGEEQVYNMVETYPYAIVRNETVHLASLSKARVIKEAE